MFGNLSDLKGYTPAKLTKGKEWFISFYAYNPETKKLARKRIKVNHIKTNRLNYCNELVKRLNNNLAAGWNPWIDPEKEKQYNTLSSTCNHFLRIAQKKLNDDSLREETYRDYVSCLRVLQKWIESKKLGDIYIYKVDKRLISDFLEYIYIDKGRTAQTRNNYLNILRVFSGFLVEKDYCKVKPTDGISSIRKGQKTRTVFTDEHLELYFEYLRKNNPYFLLASYILYYCMIRPKELSLLRVKDISFASKTILVESSISKNRKTQAVTIPNSLGRLLIDLKIHEAPGEYYLFSDAFKPGKLHKSEKAFRDTFIKIRKKLHFPNTYKFYSLKDTGITKLLELTGNPLLVRDQARHSNIAITDIYTPHNRRTARKEFEDLEY